MKREGREETRGGGGDKEKIESVFYFNDKKKIFS